MEIWISSKRRYGSPKIKAELVKKGKRISGTSNSELNEWNGDKINSEEKI